MAFDVITPISLGIKVVPTTIATLYTVSPLTRVIVKTIDITNTNSTSVKVTLHFVPAGESPSTSNTLMAGLSILSKSSLQWSGAQVLNVGDTIQAVSSETDVTVMISGGECT